MLFKKVKGEEKEEKWSKTSFSAIQSYLFKTSK